MSDLRKLFKPEQFYSKNFIQEYVTSPHSWNYVIRIEEAVAKAQEILNEALDKAVRVYTKMQTNGHPLDRDQFWNIRDNGSDPSHQALIVCIEELPKKQCEHEPHEQDYMDHKAYRNICKHCGVKLKAKWLVDETK